MRIATWNMKQVAPRRSLDERWRWMEQVVEPDLVVLTEAKVPDGGLPPGWSGLWVDGGIGHRRRWGTIVAARGCELRPVVTTRRRLRDVSVQFEHPAATLACDVMVSGQRWATVVGTYSLTTNASGESCGHGGHTTKMLVEQLQVLLGSDRGDRLVVAGDFNLLPRDVASRMKSTGLVDLVELTADTRPPLRGCINCVGRRGCGHVWTHRNGTSPNAAVQQIDYVFASPALAARVSRVFGGAGAFPDAWNLSDHAPLVAEFSKGKERKR
jgi:exonuclease III